MNLHIKDRKILAELDLDARTTFQAIGKRTRLSKETVIYRVKRLEKEGIIVRYTTLVNFARLGFTGYAVYSRFQDVNDDLKQEIIEHLERMPSLYWIFLTGGKFDIAFGLLAKNVFQFNRAYYAILNQYGRHLVDNTIAIRTELRQHKRGYLANSKAEMIHPPFFGKDPDVEELDKLDSQVLSILSNNARLPVVEIAAQLH